MSDPATETTQILEEEEKIQLEAEVIPISFGHLLQLQREIREMRSTALEGFSDTMKECKAVCSEFRKIIGDLNGIENTGNGKKSS